METVTQEIIVTGKSIDLPDEPGKWCLLRWCFHCQILSLCSVDIGMSEVSYLLQSLASKYVKKVLVELWSIYLVSVDNEAACMPYAY